MENFTCFHNLMTEVDSVNYVINSNEMILDLDLLEDSELEL